MAERRMFTKKVTDSDDFMNLSASAQALYLHLSMSADDDGFCNQVSISMFKAHASTQDLQALLENRYVYQFENGVIVIRHWRMANALRKDRYTKTTFLEELAQLDLKDNGEYERLPNGCQMVAVCLPQDRLGKDSIDKVSIGKDRLDKDSKGEDSKGEELEAEEDISRVIEAWNTSGGLTIKKLSLNSKRGKMLTARIAEYGIDEVLNAIDEYKYSSFLRGDTGFVADFEWFVKPNNFVKVWEGKYRDKVKTTSTKFDKGKQQIDYFMQQALGGTE